MICTTVVLDFRITNSQFIDEFGLVENQTDISFHRFMKYAIQVFKRCILFSLL